MTEFNDEHVPSPFAWSEEERNRYAMLADHCPMCDYKYRYGNLMNMSAAYGQLIENGGQGSPQDQAMSLGIAAETEELLALGLSIVSAQCDNNRLMTKALLQ